MRPGALLLPAVALLAQTPSRYFVVRVVDAATGRGVPLIELRLPNEVRYVTDSAGVAAIEEPSLWDHKTFLFDRVTGTSSPRTPRSDAAQAPCCSRAPGSN